MLHLAFLFKARLNKVLIFSKMKRFTFLLFFASFFSLASGQTSTGVISFLKTSLTSTNLSDTGDIITNATDTARFYINGSISPSYTNGSIQVYTSYISGTAPIVTAFLEVSNNGTTWFLRQTSLRITGDTINLTPLSGISDSDGLTFTNSNNQYCRISVHGHKTQSVGIKATACLRKDKN